MDASHVTARKEGARARLNAARDSLVALSHRIHDNPELGYEEEKASAWVSEALDAAGFAVERGVSGLPTAFVARHGSGPLNIGICAEYDCLPGIGHACGHNIIAASAVGAALALAEVADDIGLTVTVLGTPAEEVLKKGGKVLMLEGGAFGGLHAAMMVHPSSANIAAPPVIAASGFEVRYHGKSAHAAAHPDQGINAADALTIAQTAIGLLRQHLRATDRVHGIVTKGGDAFNIVPQLTTADFGVRAKTLDELGSVYERVRRCFEAGALATGATLEIMGGDRPFAHMVHDPELQGLFQRNAESLGRSFLAPEEAARSPFSTDMGNVSLALPSIHPMLDVDAGTAVIHQPEFAACAVTAPADQTIHDGALGLAWTAIDAATTPPVRERLLARSR